MNYRITQSRLLYVYSIGDERHKDLLKIGEVFVDNEVAASEDADDLRKAVREQLARRPYMKGVKYLLEYVECTTYNDTKCYSALDVHSCLENSGVKPKYLDKINGVKADIWHHVELEKVKLAIRAIKEGKKSFNGTGKRGRSKIVFRPEQKAAIDATVKHFRSKTGKRFLWNAKMRFGKTTSALEVVRQLESRATLIVTHRPVVDAGWKEDFDWIMMDEKTSEGKPLYTYLSRNQEGDGEGQGINFSKLMKEVRDGKKRVVFFVSMQYLRLSELVGGKNTDPLKKDILNYDWDLVMVDEAHEGISSTRGDEVMKKLNEHGSQFLMLSGTPFNLLEKFEEGQIYTWDYVMEQEAKRNWEEKHFGDPNPYAVLPKMEILTFTMSDMLKQKVGGEGGFKFHEFFKVWTGNPKEDGKEMPGPEYEGRFIHEAEVKKFLDMLVKNSNETCYPFSTPEFRRNLAHTFWLLPYVKEAKAMEELLKKHPVFGKKFKIVNVAGDGNIEDIGGKALEAVKDAIAQNKRTITLSCGKLTTGVSVPQWTGVLCMKGSENTPASTYMQTIFRVQTSAVIDGRQKSDCYVFDFAPDRTLTAVAETAKYHVIAAGGKKAKQLKNTQKEEEEHLQAFLKLCPVISMDGAKMGRHFSANDLFVKLKDVYVERAVKSGYSDNSLYNPEKLLNLTPEQEEALGNVHDLLGSMPGQWKPEGITVNKSGLIDMTNADDVQYVYWRTDLKERPATPSFGTEKSEKGAPLPAESGWEIEKPEVTAQEPYLYISGTAHRDGEWEEYIKPVLRYIWTDPSKKAEKTEEQKKREEENKEKRARMSVLRGVSIRIPLLVYGAELKDNAIEGITIDNFTSLVDDRSWEEYMPKGFTKETFDLLKDCFDRSIFSGAATRIRQMVKSADDLSTEDRIFQIAKIFSFFHNPDKETVLTPWRVVNMQLSDTLGGWCFTNEDFTAPYRQLNKYDEEVQSVRFVDRGEVTKEVFEDDKARILEINSKTGLYPLYMAYSIFRSAKEPQYRKIDLTGARGDHRGEEGGYARQAQNDEVIWSDVLKDNIFVVCRTDMAASITRRTLAGFKNLDMNVKCYKRELPVNDLIKAGVLKKEGAGVTKAGDNYLLDGNENKECDMIDVLRANPDLFKEDVVEGRDYWHVYSAIPTKPNEDINNMKFTAIVGNPPYQIMDGGAGASAKPVYNMFVEAAKGISPSYITMIMPSRWFAGGKGLDAFRENMLKDERISKIFDFVNAKDCFPTASIGGGVNYLLWDNKHKGNCQITTIRGNMKDSMSRRLDQFDVFIRFNTSVHTLAKCQGANSFATLVNTRNPFGISSNVRGGENGELRLISSAGESRIPITETLEKNPLVSKYKILMSKVTAEHAGEPDKNGQFKIVSRTEIIGPNDVCTDSYLIIGANDDIDVVRNEYKYLCTRFARFLLMLAVSSINLSPDKFKFIPLQDFSKKSDIDWNKSITEIDHQLYKKYGLLSDEVAFIESIIKPME